MHLQVQVSVVPKQFPSNFILWDVPSFHKGRFQHSIEYVLYELLDDRPYLLKLLTDLVLYSYLYAYGHGFKSSRGQNVGFSKGTKGHKNQT